MAVRVALFLLALLVSVDGGLLGLPICLPLCPLGKVCVSGPPTLLNLLSLTGKCEVVPGPISSLLGLVGGLLEAVTTVVTYDPNTPCVTDLAVGTLINFDAAKCGPSLNLGTALNLKAAASANVATSVVNVAGALTLATNVVKVGLGKGVVFLGAASKFVVQNLTVDASADLTVKLNATAAGAIGGLLDIKALVLAGASSSLNVDGIALALGTCLLNGGSLTLGAGAGLAVQLAGQIKAGVAAGVAGAVYVRDQVTIAAHAALDLAADLVLGVGAHVDAGVRVAAAGLLTLSAGLQASTKLVVDGTLSLVAKGITVTGDVVLGAGATLLIDARTEVITPVFAKITADTTATIKILVNSVAAVKVAGLAQLAVLTHAIANINDFNPKICLVDLTGAKLDLTLIRVAEDVTLHQALLTATGLSVKVLLEAAAVVDLTVDQLGVLANLGVDVDANTAVTTVTTVTAPLAVTLGAVAKLGGTLSGAVKLATTTLGDAAIAVAVGTSAVVAVGAGVNVAIENLVCAAENSVLLLNPDVDVVAGLGASLNATLHAGAGLAITVDKALVDLEAAGAAAVGVDLQSILWGDNGVLTLGAGIAAHLRSQISTTPAELHLCDRVRLRGVATLGGNLKVLLDGALGRIPEVIVDANANVALAVGLAARAVVGAELTTEAAVQAGAAVVVKGAGTLAVGALKAGTAAQAVVVKAVVKAEAGAKVLINSSAVALGGLALSAGSTLRVAVGGLLSKKQSEGGCACAPNLGAAVSVAANAVIEIAVEEIPKAGVFTVLTHSCPVEIVAGFVGQVRLVKLDASGQVAATLNLAVKNALTVDGSAYASVSSRRLLAEDDNCTNSFTWTENNGEVSLCDPDAGNSASRVPLVYFVYALLAMLLIAFY